MTTGRLLAAGFSLSLRRSLAFRVDLFFDVLMAAGGLLSTLATVLVVFTHTDRLAGWSRAATFALIGTFEVVSGIKAAFVDANLATLPERIRDGRLDRTLLSPAPTLVLATLGTAAPLAAMQIPLGLAVVFLGARTEAVSAAGVAAWVLLVAVAVVVMWAVGTVLAALAFWAPRLHLHILYSAAWQLGRHPADVYTRPLRLILTYVLPLALIATVPAAAMFDPPRLPAVLTVAATAAASLLLAVATWRRGLRRYTGAGG